MTTITAPLRHSPHVMRTLTTSASARTRRAIVRIRRVTEGMNSDDRARLCDVTLQGFSEARSIR